MFSESATRETSPQVGYSRIIGVAPKRGQISGRCGERRDRFAPVVDVVVDVDVIVIVLGSLPFTFTITSAITITCALQRM